MTVHQSSLRDLLLSGMRDSLQAAAQATETTITSSLIETVARSIVESVDRPAMDAFRQAWPSECPLALVAFDTPGIQRYIFAVRRPLDIEGSSVAVADLTRPHPSVSRSSSARASSSPISIYDVLAAEQLGPQHVIFAGGGGGILLVPATHADSIAAGIRKAVENASRGELRVAVAAIHIWPEQLWPDADMAGEAEPASTEGMILQRPAGYSTTIVALLARLARERSRSAVVKAGLAGAANYTRCAACLDNPATDPDPADPEEKLCLPCLQRRLLGRQSKQEKGRPGSFEEISKEYLAVVYADGANIGGVLQQLRSLLQYKALSLALDMAMQHALEAGLKNADPSGSLGLDRRYQAPIAGGDDFLAVLPGECALDFVRYFVEEFESTFNVESSAILREGFGGASPSLRLAVDRLGLGVGIAIAKRGFPIRSLVTTARQLLKEAKGKIHGAGGPRSAVDFMVLTSGTPLGDRVGSLRRETLERSPRLGTAGQVLEPECRLTERPYGLAAFRELIETARQLKKDEIPATVLYGARQSVFAGFHVSQNYWRYQVSRSSQLQAFLTAATISLDRADTWLWRPDTAGLGRMQTRIVDLAEIWRFIEV